MVSELAGKGVVPLQLPEPASRRLEIAHHSDRFRQQIRRGSLLCRGVTKMKSNNASGVNSSPASFGLRRTFKVAESLLQKLAGPGAAVDGGGLLIVKASKHDSLHAIDSFSLLFLQINADRSAILVDLMFAGSRSRSAESTMSAELIVAASLPQWRTRKKKQLCTILFVACISWSRSVESMSVELINRSSMAIVVPSPFVLEQRRSWSRSMKNSRRVLVNPLFIAFDCRSWSRSVEIDDNSSEEIEDKAENLDNDDGEELTAVNKIRCRRFIFDDEEEQEEQKDEIDVDQPEDSEKTSFNSTVQQHSSQQPWFSRQNSGGSKSLCSDLEVDHIDIQILMLVWKMQAQKQLVKNAINAHAVNIPLYVVLDIGLDTEVDMNVFNEGRPVGVEGLDLEVQEIMDILVYYLQGGQVGDSEIVFEMQQISETVATVLGMQHAKLKSSFVLIGLITEKESFNAATTWFFVPKKACVHEVAVQFLVSLHTYAGKRAKTRVKQCGEISSGMRVHNRWCLPRVITCRFF
nr:DCN1-like protein 3 [Ipomoea trifida]